MRPAVRTINCPVTLFAAVAVSLFLSPASLSWESTPLFRKITLAVADLPFNPEWMHDYNVRVTLRNDAEIPTTLRTPHFVPTFELITESLASSVLTTRASSTSSVSVYELAAEVKNYIDEHVPESGAILFRNLHRVIPNETVFDSFVGHLLVLNDENAMHHVSCFNRKRQSAGISTDFVDTDFPLMTKGPHNEHACNPMATGRIAFYGMQPADSGGETLLRRNKDIMVPHKVKDFLRRHGGLEFKRIYPDQDAMRQNDYPDEMLSWQEQCNTNDRKEAIMFFVQRNMCNVTFDDDESLVVSTILSGWEEDSHGTHVWFNHLDYGIPMKCGDGTPFPLEWQMEMKRSKWWDTYAFKLQEGDWLVLDNLQVQHGRLPYRDYQDRPRKLVVTYSPKH